jgi:hypothetical protein
MALGLFRGASPRPAPSTCSGGTTLILDRYSDRKLPLEPLYRDFGRHVGVMPRPGE